MREISADAWEVDCDVLAITTNCTITTDKATGISKNVMGGGIAKGAADKFPDLPYHYAWYIKKFGHHVYLMRCVNKEGLGYVKPLLMFPTKNEVSNPSSLTRIALSIIETKKLADIYGWKTIALPRPGCGLGGLDWHGKVKPIFTKKFDLNDRENAYYLDNRFLIVSYPGEE